MNVSTTWWQTCTIFCFSHSSNVHQELGEILHMQLFSAYGMNTVKHLSERPPPMRRPLLTSMLGEITEGCSGLSCCVPCLSSTINSLCLLVVKCGNEEQVINRTKIFCMFHGFQTREWYTLFLKLDLHTLQFRVPVMKSMVLVTRTMLLVTRTIWYLWWKSWYLWLELYSACD